MEGVGGDDGSQHSNPLRSARKSRHPPGSVPMELDGTKAYRLRCLGHLLGALVHKDANGYDPMVLG